MAEKERMKLSDFTNLIKSVNDGESLPSHKISSIYEGIAKAPLALHAQEVYRKSIQDALSLSNSAKMEIFERQTKELIDNGKARISH